jgi:glycosyltransferase involved in cell wall biosynthesis
MPLVSIGMPVHNAQRYLRQALDSLLGQDYPNFELVVSDNASTDATEQICREYAQRDKRMVYDRASANMGAVWNFNRVFELARGEYFMWAAFDDLRDPRYVSACVTALESRLDAVLCASDVRFIDEHGETKDFPPAAYGHHLVGRTPRDRLRQLTQSSIDLDFYGLARRAALAQTRRSVLTWGFDVVVLLELCLRGPVLLVPEPLFSYRRLEEKTQQDLAVGLSGSGPGETVAVCWSCLAFELSHSIWLAPVGNFEKLLLTYEFLIRYCVLNLAAAAGIRRDLTHTIGHAWSQRNWGRMIVLIGIGILVYPIQNRVGRSVYRAVRRLLGGPRPKNQPELTDITRR